MNELEDRDRRAIEEQFPGWEAWVSIKGGQWHARLKGSVPIVMLHDDTAAGLLAQVAEWMARHP